MSNKNQIQKIAKENKRRKINYYPSQTYTTYEEFERDLIEKIEIGREQIKNGQYYTQEEFQEEIRRWMRTG